MPGGLTLKAARKLASDALLDLERGHDPAEHRQAAKQKAATAKAETVQWLIENYMQREGYKLRTAAERKRTFERLVFPEIGNVPLVDLKRSHVVKFLDKVEDQCGDRMSDLVLCYLSKAFNWFALRHDTFSTPLVRGMGRVDVKARQGQRTLTDAEIAAIWKATEPGETPQPFNALIRFLLLTGARRAEANEMPWSEIVGTGWLLPARRNKVNFDLLRPLSKAAQAVLQSVPRTNDDAFVFSHDGKHPLSLTKPTRALKRVTGVQGWRLHDLRRTARTLLARAGVPDAHAERCLGHTLPGAVAQIYNKHRYETEMLAAYEGLAALIERIVNPPGDTVVALRR